MIKKLCICCILFCAVALGVDAQTVCPAGSQCTPQAVLDKCSELADKYVAVKAALDAANRQIAAMQIENVDLKTLVSKLREVGSINDQIGLTRDKLDAIKDAIIKAQADLIAQLQKKISNGKTFWQKLLVKLQILYYLAAGIAIVAK